MTAPNFTAVILAAGKGRRMKTDSPKVLAPLGGKALLLHVLDNLHAAGCQNCIVIVGYGSEEVKELVKRESKIQKYSFVHQKEQLGTGHALLCAKEALDSFACSSNNSSSNSSYPFLAASGDMPLLSPRSFQKLLSIHEKNSNIITVLSAFMKKPQGYGRLIINEKGILQKIIEEADASSEEKKIREINTGSYTFQYPDIFPLLEQVGKENAQGEYYLPELVALAEKFGLKKGFFSLPDSLEACGVNSPEELKELENLLRSEKFSGKFSEKLSGKFSGTFSGTFNEHRTDKLSTSGAGSEATDQSKQRQHNVV